MTLLVAAFGTLLGGALLALASSAWARIASAIGAGSAVVGCALGGAYAVGALRNGTGGALTLRWEVPYGWLRIETDALSAFFLIPIFALGALAAIYGAGYLRGFHRPRALGTAWFAYDSLLASMALVVVARQAVLFLVAWEVMTLCSYLCVTLDREEEEVGRAGWVFLVASHVGSGALVGLFLLFGKQAHGFDFEALRGASPTPLVSGVLACLALVGFGVKAGLVPLHVWLPEAHAAAPSHVSALMSGVLLKMGLYGLLRIVLLLGGPPSWLGPVLVGVGLLGALTGISLASYQRDMKRVLAYSSVENMGLITLAVGVAFWAAASGRPQIAALAMAAALLHAWNHTLMKGLMFLAAGSVLHGTGTRDLERLGGVLRQMPRTGSLMLLGGVAIAGLPPLNGFVSEWLLYVALLRLGLASDGATSVVALLLAGCLSFVGALAGLGFVRLVGTALLGQPRSEPASRSHESSALLVAPMAVLALACACVALFPRAVLGAVGTVSDQLLRGHQPPLEGTPLATLGGFNAAVWCVVAIGAAGAAFVLRRRPAATDATWGCGYAAPTARMQYTARAFAEMLSDRLIPGPLRARIAVSRPAALFPGPAALSSDPRDPMTRGFYEPFVSRWGDRFARLRWMQQGMIHVYVVYILVALLVGLAWSSIAPWSGG